MKYVRCDGCSNLIAEGSAIYQFPGRCGIYCSPQCFADTYAEEHELTEEVAYNSCTTMLIIDEGSPEKPEEYKIVQSFATPGQIAKRNCAPHMEGTVVKIVNDEEFICEVQGSNIICHKDFWSFYDADT